MKKQNLKLDYVFDLVNAFKSIKSEGEAILFLQDILTASEIKNLSIRLRIARLLLADKTQREICMELHVSIATVSKVNRWLTEKGEGFKRIIQKLPIKYRIPPKLPKGPIEYHLPELLLTSAEFLVADNQNKKMRKLIENMTKKELSDKITKEASSDLYKSHK